MVNSKSNAEVGPLGGEDRIGFGGRFSSASGGSVWGDNEMNDTKHAPEGWTNFGKALSHYAKASIDEAAWDQTWHDFLHLMESEDLTVDEALVSATHSSLSGSQSRVAKAVAAVRRQKRTVLAVCTGVVGVALFFLGMLIGAGSESDGPGPISNPSERPSIWRSTSPDPVIPSRADLLDLFHNGVPDSEPLKQVARKLIAYFDEPMMSMVDDESVAMLIRLAVPIIGRCPSIPQSTPWLETALRSESRRIRILARGYYTKLNPSWYKDLRIRALLESAVK